MQVTVFFLIKTYINISKLPYTTVYMYTVWYWLVAVWYVYFFLCILYVLYACTVGHLTIGLLCMYMYM